MPYVLHDVKGNTFPSEIGPLEGGVAYPITDEVAKKFKRIKHLIVFDRIAGMSEEKAQKRLYGVKFKHNISDEVLTFQHFVSKNGGDMKKASVEYDKYKLERGLK